MKKRFYIFLTIVLGIMLSLLAHAVIEMQYLKWATDHDGRIRFILGCALPVYLNFGLTLLGAVSGYFLGQTWWRIVYIEKRRWGEEIVKSNMVKMQK